MVELTHKMNETIVKAQQTPDFGASDAKMTLIKWKNISMKYVKMVKNLEKAILQKQKELYRKKKVDQKKFGAEQYGKNDPDEMTELIEPEFTGDEGSPPEHLKQRTKGVSKGETFEEFMKRRSKRIGMKEL